MQIADNDKRRHQLNYSAKRPVTATGTLFNRAGDAKIRAESQSKEISAVLADVINIADIVGCVVAAATGQI
jgi:hypothetical protein